MALGLALGGAALATTTACESRPRGPVGIEDLDSVEAPEIDFDKLPEYTSRQVSKNNGKKGSRIWMSYGGLVYDVTEFVANHPGGSEKITEASGKVSSTLYWKRQLGYSLQLDFL